MFWKKSGKTKVLFVAAHCDDLELACGGTIARLQKTCDISCYVASQSIANGELADVLQDMCQSAMTILGVPYVTFGDATTCRFAEKRQQIWDALNLLPKPDIVITHERDEHQDHVVMHDEVYRVFKSSSILHFPGMVSCPNFQPDLFIKLEEEHVNLKLKALKAYSCYTKKLYFDRLNITSYMRVAGLRTGESGFAEGYRVGRLII